MKALKIFAFVVGGVVVLCALLLILALTPSVQTWAARKAVADLPGMKIELGRVAAGFSSAELSDVRVANDSANVTVKHLSARYSAWDYLTKKRINVESAIVTDAVVDLRKPTAAGAANTPSPAGAPASTPGANPPPGPAISRAPAQTSTPAAPFDGVLKQAQLPFDVRVAHLSANGRALLADGQTVTFELKGANVETGQRGQLDWKADFSDAKAGAALRAARASGTLALHIAPDRRIDTVDLDGSASVEGPNLPADRFKLTLRAAQTAAAANETYSVSLGLDRAGTVETLIAVDAEYAAAARNIAGTWKLEAKPETLSPFLAGLGLPDLAANGAGKFSVVPGTSAAAASGALQGTATRLEKISPELASIGTVRFRTNFDGGLAGETARLDRLQVEVLDASDRRLAHVETLQRIAYATADRRVTLADPKAEVARVAVQALPLAWAQPFVKSLAIDSGDLSLALLVEAEADGSHVRARAVEPLTLRNVTVRSGQTKLADRVNLRVRPNIDYTPTQLTADLTELDVSTPAGDHLGGKASAAIADLATRPASTFSAQLDARIVAALKPYLPLDPGPLTLALALDGKHQGDVLQVAKLSADVKRENGSPLAALELQQPVTANLTAQTVTLPNPQTAVARVRLGEVPLAWAQAFVPKSQFAGAVTGGAFDVTLRALDDVTVAATAPLVVRGASATLAGKPQVQALDVSADFTATKHGDTIAYEVRRLAITQNDAALASLTATGSAKLGPKLALTAKGNLEADAPALMKQPAAAAFATLSRGRVASSFDATVGETMQAKLTLTARDLVARQNNQALGDLELSVDAQMKADGSGTVSAPVKLTNAKRRSDVTVDGVFGRSSDQKTFLFTGKIASNELYVADFQPLAALAPSTEKPVAGTPSPAPRTIPTPASRPGAPGTPTAPARRDAAPFWNGVQGKVAVDLKRVVYGTDYVIGNVRGTSVITDTKLSLDGLEGRFKENPFKLAGGITFAANQAKPYALIASADVQGLDIGEILRASAPNEKPIFETKATLKAALNGNGGTIGDLMQSAYGKFDLTGTEGVTRLLARKGGAGTAVNIASLGLAILGAAQKSEGLTAAAELTRLLNEVRFDSVKVQVERAADLSFKLTSIEILSPILRTAGTGTVASKSADDVANAPMNIVLQLAAKGELAYALQRAGLLSDKQDDKGYALMSRTFTVGGTPSKPNNSALWSLLLETGLGAFGR